jgi:molybdate transport system substrate-binding protein
MHKVVIFAVGLLVATGANTSAAEINFFSANGARLMVNALVPEFEHTTNNRVITKFEEPGILRKSILDGEAFDLIILPAGWDEVRAKIAGNPISIAHTDFGILVRADAPKPDTSSNDAVKRTLLAAKSIVYTDPKTGAVTGVLFARMIERLGIANEVNKKSKIVPGPPVEFLTKGEVDLAIAFGGSWRFQERSSRQCLPNSRRELPFPERLRPAQRTLLRPMPCFSFSPGRALPR